MLYKPVSTFKDEENRLSDTKNVLILSLINWEDNKNIKFSV